MENTNTDLLKDKLLIMLEEYIDLINKEKQRFEVMVWDMEEVESLTQYQKLVEKRTEVDEIITILKGKKIVDFSQEVA